MGLGDQLPCLTGVQPNLRTEHDCQSSTAEIHKRDLDCLPGITIQLQKALQRPIHVPAIG